MKSNLFSTAKLAALSIVLTLPFIGLIHPASADSSILALESNTPTDHERPDPAALHTVWRYWETYQSQAFKMDSGEIVHTDVYRPAAVVKDAKGAIVKDASGKSTIGLRPPKEIQQSALPPEGWQNADFDDSTWFRADGPMSQGYRSLSLVCVRGKFQVNDPAAAGELSLNIGYRGGVVAYLNGKEIGRANLPQGKIATDTLADPYPPEAYVTAKGDLINERSIGQADYSTYVISSTWAARYGNEFKDKDTLDRYQKRTRHTDIKIPASALQKGINVLSLELHGVPANEIMYKAIGNNKDLSGTLGAVWAVQIAFLGRIAPGVWWNHVGLEDVHLSGSGAGVVANVGRPKGMQVWNESVFKRILPTQYGDPNEPLRAVKIAGVRNGTCSGEIVVGSSDALKGLKVTVSDLAGSAGGSIPAAAVQVSYPAFVSYSGYPEQMQYDALDPEAPAELQPVVTAPWSKGSQKMGQVSGVVQPVWFSVQVPKDAALGTYTGKVTVSAAGEKAIETTVEVKIGSEWVMPDPSKFTTYVGILESPDSVAQKYKVAMWSDEHWKLMDKVMGLLGELGNREVYIPLITKTMFGNEQSMVRWIKQPDGTYKYDFSIAERYLDLAVNHHWNISVTCLGVSDGNIGEALWYSGKPRNPPSVTLFDPATNTFTEMKAPMWGTPEARVFWKPVIEGMQDILKKRGLEKTMMFGFVVQRQVLSETIGDLKSIAPDALWWEYTHWSEKLKGVPPKTKGVLGPNTQNVGRMSWAYGSPLAVFWDPDTDTKGHYAWKTTVKDVYFVAAPRAKGQINVGEIGELSIFRLFSESTLLGSHQELLPEFGPFIGWGEVGADFWPSGTSSSGTGIRLDAKYVGWGSLSLVDTMENLLGAGKSAPTASCRTQMLRESLQEAEARVFVQNALLDAGETAKLGAPLAAECKQLCDDRTKMLFYCTVYFGENGLEYGRVFNQSLWDAQTEKLYEAAAKVAKALGTKE